MFSIGILPQFYKMSVCAYFFNIYSVSVTVSVSVRPHSINTNMLILHIFNALLVSNRIQSGTNRSKKNIFGMPICDAAYAVFQQDRKNAKSKNLAILD